MRQQEQTRVWRPGFLPGVELLRARFLGQRFARHFHEGYCLGVIESGALAFRYRGREVVAPAGSVNLAVPGEVHDGHAAGDEGWAYRMFYLDPAALAPLLKENDAPPRFGPGVLHDPALARALARLHRELEAGGVGPLEGRTRFLGLMSAWMRRHAEHGPHEPAPTGQHPGLERVRAMLAERCHEELPLAELAAEAGLSPWHMARSFATHYGLPPHAYRNQERVRRAALALRSGASPAEAGAGAGFADQAHLTRWFRRLMGLTPARYRKDVQDS
ncbi:MAG: AraC family ligand binding domain-containing protein [Desulfovibrionaceae bacterium]